MAYPQVEIRNVLITGCSSGIGAAAARILASRGWTVIPTARKPDHMDRLREMGLCPVHLDLSTPESVVHAARRALEIAGGRLGAIVNNAGYGQPGAMEDLDREMLRRQFEVNLFGLMELTNFFIPHFIRQGFGRVVNVSSMVGRIALPFMGAYSASKFALEAVSDAMRVELNGSGVAVSLIEPGPIATRFGGNARYHLEGLLGKSDSRFLNFYQRFARSHDEQPARSLFRLPPEAVARKIVHALESRRPRTRYPVTIPAHLGLALRRLLPDRLLDRLMILYWRRKTGLTAL